MSHSRIDAADSEIITKTVSWPRRESVIICRPELSATLLVTGVRQHYHCPTNGPLPVYGSWDRERENTPTNIIVAYDHTSSVSRKEFVTVRKN